MKKRNYMFKFSLSITLFFVLPIEIIVYSIFLPINYQNGNLDIKDLFFNIGLMLITVLGLFFIIAIIAFIMQKLTDVDKLDYKDNKIMDGSFCINENNIKTILARRFLFLYQLAIVEKYWVLFPTRTYYFYDKEELIDFLSNNKFLFKYVKEKDLLKLGIRNY